MLKPDSLRRRVSQAPLKETVCHAGCGAQVHYRTNPRVYCAPCQHQRKLARARATAERRRRALGVAPVKGTEILCKRCARPFVRKGIAAKFCPPCRPLHQLEIARAASRMKAATEEGREYTRQWFRQKRAKSPAYRVSEHMKVMMHRAFGAKKAGRSWRSFVPYTLEQLMAHLERQFVSGMTWDNKGKWHIDHIRPLSSFNFESPSDPEFQEAWALSNLRPLWGVDNIRKQARRTHLL